MQASAPVDSVAYGSPKHSRVLYLQRSVQVDVFSASELDRYVDCLADMHGYDEPKREDSRKQTLYGEADERWRHYIGSVESVPCCESSMFVGDGVAYLEWCLTLPSHRGRGCHTEMIRRRLSEANACGCALAFAVTDVGIPSARNLQRHGFRLAYNYVMLTGPLPAEAKHAT